MSLAQISVAKLKALIATLLTQQTAWGRIGLSAKTVREAVKFAVRLMRHAVDLGWIDREPKTPRVSVPESDLAVWTLSEAESVRASLPNDPVVRAMFLVQVRTGVRLGELRGLQWKDLDVERSALKIERQLMDDGEVRLPKHNHQRTVFVPADALAAILALPKQGAFIFDRGGGEVLSRQKLGYRIIQACKQAGVRVGSNHAARRTVATGAAALGIGTLSIAEQLGHARVSTTDTYIKRFRGSLPTDFERLAPKTRKTGTQKGGSSQNAEEEGTSMQGGGSAPESNRPPAPCSVGLSF